MISSIVEVFQSSFSPDDLELLGCMTALLGDEK